MQNLSTQFKQFLTSKLHKFFGATWKLEGEDFHDLFTKERPKILLWLVKICLLRAVVVCPSSELSRKKWDDVSREKFCIFKFFFIWLKKRKINNPLLIYFVLCRENPEMKWPISSWHDHSNTWHNVIGWPRKTLGRPVNHSIYQWRDRWNDTW